MKSRSKGKRFLDVDEVKEKTLMQCFLNSKQSVRLAMTKRVLFLTSNRSQCVVHSRGSSEDAQKSREKSLISFVTGIDCRPQTRQFRTQRFALWFQQDGATCHTVRAKIDLLKDTFGDRLISRFGPVNWPPRSCDLTPLDFFLWGYVKPLVYADKPQTLDHLEDNIRRVIADIRPQMLEKVIENWTSRLDYIRASRGSPMPETIFKIYSRALGDGPRNLKLRSSGEDDILVDILSPNLHPTPTRGLKASTYVTCIDSLCTMGHQ
ncbi:uncharacterized protein TNCV_5083041 [Trichonephila clavipes]|nr:uncharacterized protein TNCV_5083041 [Trichonephila clavipes]